MIINYNHTCTIPWKWNKSAIMIKLVQGTIEFIIANLLHASIRIQL